MAAGNESQGLKIAVAIFVSLTVILAVTAYFMFSEYSKASEQLAEAQKKANDQQQAANKALSDFRAVRDLAGYSDKNDSAAVIEAAKADLAENAEKLAALNNDLSDLINEAQGLGLDEPQVTNLRGMVQDAVTQFNDATVLDPTFSSVLDLLAELTASKTRLSMALSRDNIRLRNYLESVDTINKAELDTQVASTQKTQEDLRAFIEQNENEQDRLRNEIADLQSERATLIAERDRIQTQMARTEEDFENERRNLMSQLLSYRTMAEKEETVLDIPDGQITFVDYSRREVRTNLNRGMGARPQMSFSVFDRDAPGLPSDRPKARIELTQVGERDSVARIAHQHDTLNPLRVGDQVYSPAWTPQESLRFALIGKIDMNRDGRDDREDLKRLIESAGGIVEYDLPPPAVGQEQGEMTAMTAWYVIDEREPIRTPGNIRDIERLEEGGEQFYERRSEVIERALRLGVRPMPIQRLLPALGYSHGMLIPGRVEAADRRGIERLLNPEGLTAPAPGTEEFERRREEMDTENGFDPFDNF